MGLQTIHLLSCNRCGQEVKVSVKWGGGLAEAVEDASAGSQRWKKVDNEIALCPDCTCMYESMMAQHAKDMEEFYRKH